MDTLLAKNSPCGAFLAYVLILLFTVTSSAMAALLGVSPGLPKVYTSQTGTTSFNADSGIYHVQTTPLAIQGINGGGFYTITNGTLNYSLVVDSAGNVVDGVSGDDFILTGDIDTDGDGVPDFSGTLLTGEIGAFGFLNGGSTDLFDFIYTSVGGSLAPEYAGSDIAVTNTSENSSFNGSFADNFSGLSKTVVGTTPPAPASLGDYVWEDLNGNGIQNNGEPGIDNVPVSLTDCQGNPAKDFDGNPVISPILTANDGFYEFTNLRPYVDYCVEFTPPAGYEFTEQNAPGSTPDNDSNPDPVTGITPPVNLDSGEHDPTIDAGLYRPGALGNYLWEDLDRDGIQNEPADAGINGQNVFLLTCADALVKTTTTADLGGDPLIPGYYLFDDLKPGCYVVEFTKPDGYVYTDKNVLGAPPVANDSDADKGTGRTNPIDLQSGQTDLTWDAGVYEPIEPELGDFVWEDLNGNGRQDPNEPGIENVTVNLKDCVGNFLTSMTTGADGKYLFTSPDVMVNGCYVVEFVEPDHYCADSKFTMFQALGVDPALDSDAPTSDQVNLTSPDNLVDLTIDAGVVCPAALGNYLWKDLDQDGIQNESPEDGINGQQVFLRDCALNPVADTVTANDAGGDPGYYLFEDLLPGCYVVEFTKPANFVFTEKNAPGSTPADDSDADQGTGQTAPIDLESGETDLTWDAGVFLPIEPELGDFVWEDKNVNGIQDPNEPGINGATVNLYKCTDLNNPVATTVTADLNGNPLNPGYYLFTPPDVEVDGCYVVEFVEPVQYCEGAQFTDRHIDDPKLDSDAPLSDEVNLTPPDNLVDLTIDAGVICPAALGDYVWEDDNRDGIQNEPLSAGLNGVVVDLMNPGNDGLCNTGDEFVIETTTTADSAGNPGYYLFAPLDPGSYCVEVTKPDGFKCTDPNVGPNQPSPVDSDVIPTGSSSTMCQTQDPVENPIVLESGEFDDTWDAGLYQPASLGDYVWSDLNADGIQNDGNTGINDVTVNLYDCSGAFMATTATADDGNGNPGYYLFDDLNPGCYEVEFINPDEIGPDAYMFSPRQVDGDPDSGVNSDGPLSDPVVLASGDHNPTIDAGLFRKGSIHVFGFLDIDGNGIQDGGDGAFPDDPGKTFQLLDANGNLINTQKTMSGEAWFVQLIPGTYRVRENPIPAGYSLTTLPNERTYTIISGQELVYEEGAADLPQDDKRFETDLGDELKWGNTELASLGDYVWEDLNADGIQNDGNTGINDVTVNLYDCGGTPQGSTVTADDGNGNPGYYLFDDLNPGCYEVEFVNPDTVGPDAYMFSPQNQGGDDAKDSDADTTTGRTGAIDLSSGENDLTWDAGLFRKGSIHVFGFLDIDGDGIQDDGEGAFPDDPGKTFELLDENGDLINTQKTMSGEAWFVQLMPGTYTVRENPIPSGYSLTTLPNERTYTIISGQELVYEDGAADLPADDQRFETNLGDKLKWGNTAEKASLGDYVWEDLNANGLQDDGNTGINDVLVLLYDCSGNFKGATATADDGNGNPGYYLFDDLAPGCYKVTFVNPDTEGPDAYMFSPRQVDGDPNSGVNSDGPLSDEVLLASGDHNPTIDAGLFRKGSIHVFGFLDIDGNGIQDGGDGAFPDDPGKTFQLLDENGDLISTESTMSGAAWFVQLMPGTYTVRENPIPAGYSLTTLPNERTYTIISGQELVYEEGAAELPTGDQRFETDLGDELKWGNTVSFCEVAVEKTCLIVTPPVNTLPGKCSGKLQEITLIWTGNDGISIQPGNGTASVSPTLVDNGDEITLIPDGSTNDVFINIIGASSGSESKFHVSCSDGDMNADDDNDVQPQLTSQDCGKYEGDGKDNNASLVNAWTLEGLIDADGLELDCTAGDPGDFPTETEECVFTPQAEAANCDALKDVNQLTMVWNGADNVTMTTELGQVITGVDNGDVVVFEAPNALTGNDVDVFLSVGVTGTSRFHTSCSDPAMYSPADCDTPQGDGKGDDASLINDFLFGGMRGDTGEFGCPGTPSASAGTEVVYGIQVDNLSDEELLVRIVDSKLGIDETETIPANSSYEQVTDPYFIVPDASNVFENTVVVTAKGLSGATCEDSDSVKVRRLPPPPAPVSCSDIDPLTALSMVWTGEDGVTVTTEMGEVFDNLQTGNQITFMVDKGVANDFPVYLTYSDGSAGESQFHLSCSDPDMNGSDDCGTAQGNNKSNDPSLDNSWLLDGMDGQNGSFDCGLPNTGVVDPEVLPPSDNVDLLKAFVDNNKLKLELKNIGDQDLFITRVSVEWELVAKELKKMKLAGDFVKDIKSTDGTTDVPTDKAFESDPNKRKLKKDEKRNLEIEFAEDLEKKGLDAGDFTVIVEFDDGSIVNLN